MKNNLYSLYAEIQIWSANILHRLGQFYRRAMALLLSGKKRINPYILQEFNKIRRSPNFSYFIFVISLPLLSGLILYLHTVTHSEFLLNIANIPLEILAGGIIVEQYLARREKKRRERQLMFIKSCLFRADLRTLYLTNFGALAHPDISMQAVKTASPDLLAHWLRQAENARYRSPEAMEAVIVAYINAYQVFNRFLEWAIANDFEKIFQDMIMLMHFIHDARLFKDLNPDAQYVSKALHNPELMRRIETVLSDGIKSFLKFCIELKQHRPELFDSLIDDYLFTAHSPFEIGVRSL